jgi:CRISPR-associated protein Cmr2
MNERFLLLFTIGPVKSVVENSRKMRDLYAGSYLLSHLIESALNYLERQNGVEIILPIKGESNVPNRILAKVSGLSQTERTRLAQALEQTVRERFRTIWDSLFGMLGIRSAAAQSQLERFPEVYWVYDALAADEPFATRITGKLQDVKRLRPFSQSQEPAGRKCALFPAYNALFVQRNSENKLPSFIDKTNAVDVSDIPGCEYALKPSEGLSALAFVKRMLYIAPEQLQKYNRTIPSVAYMLLKGRLKANPEAMELLLKLGDEASEAIFDLQNGQVPSEKEYSKESIDCAKALYAILQHGKIRISPYYAMVKFDGDDMGKLYQQCTEEEQTTLSRSISSFAADVRAIIEQYDGVCVYAGGEDFLGALPLGTLMPALLALRRVFQEVPKPPALYDKPLTFSAGIVAVHLMQPLNEVLSLVDEMEAYAKQNPEKDSYAIATVKRGGSGLRIRSRFGDGGWNLEALWVITCDICRNRYSTSSVNQLATVLQNLEPPGAEAGDGMVRALIVQALRSPKDGWPCASGAAAEAQENLFRFYCQFGRDIQGFIAALETASFWGKEISLCIIE